MTYILIALQFLPLVLQAVKAVEDAVGAGQGATKKTLVMSAVEAAAHVGEKADDKKVAALSSLVDQVVAILNAASVFVKSPKAA